MQIKSSHLVQIGCGFGGAALGAYFDPKDRLGAALLIGLFGVAVGPRVLTFCRTQVQQHPHRTSGALEIFGAGVLTVSLGVVLQSRGIVAVVAAGVGAMMLAGGNWLRRSGEMNHFDHMASRLHD